MRKNNYTVSVNIIVDENGKSIVNVLTPKNQENLNVSQLTHILIGGVTLLVKSCETNDLGIKDHELMKEIYTHLGDCFISNEFTDAKSFITKK